VRWYMLAYKTGVLYPHSDDKVAIYNNDDIFEVAEEFEIFKADHPEHGTIILALQMGRVDQ